MRHLFALAAILTLVNASGQAVNQVSLAPKGGVASDALQAPIANGQTGTISFDPAKGCVFDMTFTFASGKTVKRPDTDICQTDTMTVE